MSETVLLTGASGFLGTAVAELLIENGYRLKCMVRKKGSLRKRFLCEEIVADINKPDSLSGISKSTDIVVHVAGLTKSLKSSEFYKVNYEGTKNLINSLDKSVKHFIYISSLSAAGPRKKPKEKSFPVSHYGKSKLLAEKETMKLKISKTIIRPPALYGPYDKDFFTVFRSIKKGYALIPKSENFLSLMHVKDAARAVLFAIKNGKNRIYEIDDGAAHKQLDIIKTIIQIVNPKARLISVPIALINMIKIVSCTGIFGALINPDKLTESKHSWVADSSLIASEGFLPKITLEDGLRAVSQWYENNNWYKK